MMTFQTILEDKYQDTDELFRLIAAQDQKHYKLVLMTNWKTVFNNLKSDIL